jgi:cytochrome P450
MSGNQRPAVDVDLFSDEVLTDPYPVYRKLRDIGGAVYLEKHGLWALPRYETVRFALGNPDVFTSNDGVAMSDEVNAMIPDIILNDDGEPHRKMRAALQPLLTARAIRKLTDEIDEEAERLVSGVLRRDSFDAAKEVANILPVSVVARLIGLREDRRMKLLDWGNASFTVIGPMNDRTLKALPELQEFLEYLTAEAAPEKLEPDSWGTAIYAAGERGELPMESCFQLMFALAGAGMETTISAIASLFRLFAEYPGEWDKVRAEPDLAASAFSEAVRLESPIQFFSRVARRDFVTGGVTVPAGARAIVMYGSANRDERQWPSPDTFDVRRDAASHLGFGYGLHFCVGKPLAQIEAVAVLKALIPRVERFHAGPPAYSLNNIARRIESLPITITRPLRGRWRQAPRPLCRAA